MLKGWKKDSICGILTTKKITAKAQFLVLLSKKGIRLRENLTELRNEAVVASLERAERNQHVANAKDVQRWLIPKNQIIFQWRSTPK